MKFLLAALVFVVAILGSLSLLLFGLSASPVPPPAPEDPAIRALYWFLLLGVSVIVAAGVVRIIFGKEPY